MLLLLLWRVDCSCKLRADGTFRLAVAAAVCKYSEFKPNGPIVVEKERERERVGVSGGMGRETSSLVELLMRVAIID